MMECSVLELHERLGSGVQLIDVREHAEFAAGRVAAAKLLPLGSLAERAAELETGAPLYVICRTGRRSAQAAAKLSEMGFAEVVNVAGGIEAWKKADLPLDRDEYAPWSIERQVRFTAGLIVLAGVLLSIFVHPYFIALSGLVGFGLAFTAVIDWCGMGLLLAKMPWNRISETK